MIRTILSRPRPLTVCLRTMSSKLAPCPALEQYPCREVAIPVPWGVIAARDWGPEDGVPWLGLHGWLDNAGTFDPLVRHFPDGHRLICIDFPGHGLSSHLPKGEGYNIQLESIGYIQRVRKFLGLEKFWIIGHSMGAGLGSLYTATFPEHVRGLVMMDLIKITSRGNHEVVQKTRDAITERLAMEEKFQNKPEKVYKTHEEALARLLESSDMLHGKNSVTEESARIILKRGLRPSNCGSGFVFTRDLRLVLRNLHGLSGDFLMEFARNIQCPHLLIKATDGRTYDDPALDEEALQIYSSNPLYTHVTVSGPHHVHLNSPQLVAPHILQFVQRHTGLTNKL